MQNKNASYIIYMEVLDSCDEDESINTTSPLRIFLIKDNDGTKCFCM